MVFPRRRCIHHCRTLEKVEVRGEVAVDDGTVVSLAKSKDFRCGSFTSLLIHNESLNNGRLDDIVGAATCNVHDDGGTRANDSGGAQAFTNNIRPPALNTVRIKAVRCFILVYNRVRLSYKRITMSASTPF